MISEYSKEIQNWIKSKLLRPGDKVTDADGKSAAFNGFPKTYRGRLLADAAQHGAEPGMYRDRSQVCLAYSPAQGEDHVALSVVPLDDIKPVKKTFDELFADASEDIHFISLSPDKLFDLPDTQFMEGDTVCLTDDQHPEYIKDNQFTIYRVDYLSTENPETPTKYKLRAGAKQFWANENQLFQLAPGPVRLFYGGEGYKLLWPSAKAEAEFFILLGRFNKVYNPTAKSYYWSLDEARQLVDLGKAHAILQQGLFEYYLINFWDSDVVSAIAGQPDLILDI